MTNFPVVFGIDLDAESSWLGKSPENAGKPVLLSHGTYEIREGLKFLLDVLDRHDVRSTFFIPGLIAHRHPEAVTEIFRRGHEVASHGYNHLSPPLLDAGQERKELASGIETLEKITGRRPVTWQAPSWEITARTIDYLIDEGVSVSSNFHDSTRPYRHVRNGVPLPLVELPVEWHLADAPFFLYGGMPGRQIWPPLTVEEMWKEDFRGLYEREGSYFRLALHVQLIAHPGRLRMLERFIQFIKEHPNAYFTRCDELAATIA